MEKPLHKVFWLWLPIIFIIFQICIEMTLSGEMLSQMHSENGTHELLQTAIIFTAFLIASRTLFSLKGRSLWLIIWITLAAICSLYVTGEEISWGQHILNWSTPENWQTINDQGETNLHNTSSWFDQKPRLVLLAGAVIGGIIIPMLQHFKQGLLPQQFSIIYPPAILGITAFLALGINLIDKISETLISHPLFARGSEVEEIYLFYFVLLYLIILRRRII